MAVVLLALLACAPTSSVAPPSVAPAPSPPVAPAAPALDHRVWTSGGQADDVPLPLVVALHGLGDDPDAFRHFLRGYPGDLRVIAPGAPFPWHGGGSWLEDPLRGDAGRLAEGLVARADDVVALLHALDDAYATVGRPVVTGFSQGGMLSFALAVTHPEAFAGAVPVGGLLPPSLLPRPATAAQAAIPVRALHGADDTRVPTAAAERTVADLRAAGVDATLRIFPGVGHAVPREVHEAVRDEVEALVRAELRRVASATTTP